MLFVARVCTWCLDYVHLDRHVTPFKFVCNNLMTVLVLIEHVVLLCTDVGLCGTTWIELIYPLPIVWPILFLTVSSCCHLPYHR